MSTATSRPYQGTTDPNHETAGFPTTCETCHKASDSSWNQATFDHGTYPLVGVHATQPCQSCHASGVYAGLPSECVDCHLAAYQGTTEPNHQTAGFPTTCETCHKASDSDWNQATFDHATYPLVGVHATQPCQSCHASGVYAGLPSECVDCHLAAYQGTTDPNHQTAGFPTTCETCHNASDTSWDQGQFDHSTYPLVGVHATQPCQSCHASGVYAGLPSECVDCHLAAYQGTTDPNHQTAGFPTTCETCHNASDTSWDQGQFDHSTYPLVGVHATQPCQSCHASGVYAGLPSECVDCHLAAYQGTTDPNHQTAGFPTTCETCHNASDTSWDQGQFDHSTYPLVGVHATQPCQACHASGVYAGLPSECVDCHLAAYQGTTDPDHQAAGFPTTCETCHNASDASWDQGQFDHVWFPIQSGRHSGNPCSACHPAAGVFTVFTCTTSCHPRGETDRHHNEVSGYVYESAACYSCHPQGQGGDAPVRLVGSHGRR